MILAFPISLPPESSPHGSGYTISFVRSTTPLQLMLTDASPFHDAKSTQWSNRKLFSPLSFSLVPTSAWCDEEIIVDARGSHHAFPHYWEQMFGSGRAILTFRESYRQRSAPVKRYTDFKYMRFHAILHDEVGIYEEDKQGNPVYNFSYVDQIYDGLLANGVRPFVELSFMPGKLASRQAVHVFKYHPIVAPPRDYARWDALIAAFAAHLIARYGLDEVAQWYFEVWNEPNLISGREPRRRAVISRSTNIPRRRSSRSIRGLSVGGPSTAQAAWVAAFIRHMREECTPLRFCVHARVRQRYLQRCLRELTKKFHARNGMPSGAKSAR